MKNYMQFLLKHGDVSKDEQGLIVRLYNLFGEESPQVNSLQAYVWKVQLKCGKEYSYVEELQIDFSFVDHLDTAHFSLEDYVPQREREEIATLTLTPIPQISVSIPISHEKIHTSKTPSKITWIFKDINLQDSHDFSKTFEGAVGVKFSSKSAYHHIFIAMTVIPKFSKKRYFRKLEYCISPPKIEAKNVKDECKPIVPWDPKRGEADRDNPMKRIFKYDYIIDQGTLYKGDIRNVSLRAKTLAIFFNTLKTGLSEDLYYKSAKNAGREVGKNFVEELEKVLGHRPTIKEWFDYDSSAGMGRFEMNDEKDTIIVENSFTAYEIKSDKPICSFLEGYFEGILPEIRGKANIIVTETKCIAKGDKECVFKIE